MTNELIIEDGPITRLTINRPERHNALNTEVGDEMIDVVTRVGRDPTVQVLILGGTGKSFTSGDDRKDERTHSGPHSAPFNQGQYPYHQLQTLLRRIPQPVIAEVHGYCMGSGFDLMLASDFAIADPDSQLKLVITATAFLPKYVGLKHAWRLILDDGFTSAQEAADLGLITKVAAPGALAEEVSALAESLAEIGRTQHGSLGVLKEALNRSFLPALDDDLRMQLITSRMRDLYQLHPPADAVDRVVPVR